MDLKKIKEQVILSDDYILQQKSIKILKYGKELEIKPINWFYDWKKFSTYLGIFLQYYYVVCYNSKLPDSLNELKEFKDNVQTTISNKKAFNALCKICQFSGLPKRWMKRHFSIDDWAEVFVWCFFFQVIVPRRELSDALKAIGQAHLV